MTIGIILSCLAALLPSVTLYLPNMAEIPFLSMAPYFGIMIMLGIFMYLGHYAVFRRKALAAVSATVWLLFLLNIGRIAPAVTARVPWFSFRVIAPAALLILAAAAFLLSKVKEEFLRDAALAALIALTVFYITSTIPAMIRNKQDDTQIQAEETAIDLTPAKDTDRPNIYWIISDEYAGIDELQKYYEYDNSPFYNALRDMGFTVSEHSYNWSVDTYTILRDIIHLDYTTPDGRTNEEMVADREAPLWQIFRSLGYRLYEMETDDKFTLDNLMEEQAGAKTPETMDGDTVPNLLIRYSILYRYENDLIRLITPEKTKEERSEFFLRFFSWGEDKSHYTHLKNAFTAIYIKSPHTPYMFDEDGNPIPSEHERNHEDKKYYLGQLKYITKHLQKICEAIHEADPDSIIVLQSDHGCRSVKNVTLHDETNILNAVYFRGKPIGEITDTNGLNTWLGVLRKQFRLELESVEERRLKNVVEEKNR